MFLPSIEKNTKRCGKGSKKNQIRKNTDLQCMLKTKEANGTFKVDVLWYHNFFITLKEEKVLQNVFSLDK
jgi:hypothetical protein